MYGKEVYLKFIYKLFLVHPPIESEINDDNEEMSMNITKSFLFWTNNIPTFSSASYH